MRYIGGKTNLLSNLKEVIYSFNLYKGHTFCDLFAGTCSVSRCFQQDFKIISNDFLNFSFVLQKAYLGINKIPSFEKVNDYLNEDIFYYFNNKVVENKEEYFILNNYSTYNSNRMYFSEENAKRIDFIRLEIERFKNLNLLNDAEYYYLIATLIETVPFYSNITGTYGAYLKHYDKRALKSLELKKLVLGISSYQNQIYNEDASTLIEKISGDILYLDPPYNERQYAPNYHILETIAKYDYPNIKGVTGMRDYSQQISLFSRKNHVKNELYKLINKAKFNNIILSYSSDGILSKDEIIEIFKDNKCKNINLHEINYRKYQGARKSGSQVIEYIFSSQKDIQKSKLVPILINIEKEDKILARSNLKNTYVKGPFNYIGGKYKLLNQILPKFSKNINTFYDLFAGGCNVGINVDAKKIVFNDLNSKIIEFYQYVQDTTIEVILKEIYSLIDSYKLSKSNQDGFLKLRNDYNQKPNSIKLYTLISYSYNYQIRFNNNLLFNNPFGKNRSYFSDNMKNNLLNFKETLSSKNILFMSKDFESFDLDVFKHDDLIYCDPPYLITTGSYNDGNRGFKDWNEKSELALLSFLDKLNERGIKFALSNVIEHKGKSNLLLKEWIGDKTVYNIKSSYSSSSYNTSKKESKEVLICNFNI